MKKCIYCGEEIQDEAIYCRYCHRDLAEPSSNANNNHGQQMPPPPHTQNAYGQQQYGQGGNGYNNAYNNCGGNPAGGYNNGNNYAGNNNRNPYQGPQYNPNGGSNNAFDEGPEGKSRGVTALLAILLGGLGVQYFYLGKIGAGFITIALTLITCGIWEIITLIQGILMFCMNNQTFRQKYVLSNSAFPLF